MFQRVTLKKNRKVNESTRRNESLVKEDEVHKHKKTNTEIKIFMDVDCIVAKVTAD